MKRKKLPRAKDLLDPVEDEVVVEDDAEIETEDVEEAQTGIDEEDGLVEVAESDTEMTSGLSRTTPQSKLWQ